MPTALPDLPKAAEEADAAARKEAEGTAEKSGTESDQPSSGGSSSWTPRRRNLALYPFFSERFPWRRLRMTPEKGIIVRPAGKLVWPMPQGSSPLKNLLGE